MGFVVICALWVTLLYGLATTFYGCMPQEQPVASVPPRMPIITMQDTYPAGQTAEEFWMVKRDFFRQYDERLKAGQVGTEEQEAMRHLYELELLRRAGEGKIREYNKYALQQNQENGYPR
jgi:hypothetical protein